jgi:isoamylase
MSPRSGSAGIGPPPNAFPNAPEPGFRRPRPHLRLALLARKCYVPVRKTHFPRTFLALPRMPTFSEPGDARGPKAESAIDLSIASCHAARLGAEVVPGGVRFAVYSENARDIHLVLFAPGTRHPAATLRLPDCRGHVFQGFVAGIGPGWGYGFHAEGPFDPRRGHRFNPRKFLIDPYARALDGDFRNVDGVLGGHVPSAGHDADLERDHRPSLDFMPRGLVVDDAFDWQGVEAPEPAREDLVIYEAHVRGFTRDPSSGVAHPGTFLGLVEKIPHLKSLGVNAVELLPVHAKYSEDLLRERGLVNYWGYNSASFFALEPSYGTGRAPGCELAEFKTMVRELHRAGIRVLLDVVYNHTAEGSELGPTLSLRGLDNASYYALTGPEDAPARHYRNVTGCGNTLDFGKPAALRLALDSLRYFAEETRVDGFRFDLATVHGRRGGSGFDPEAPFFAAAAQDPVLSRKVLVAEPWDVESHATGRFPPGWMEWNDRFRDAARDWVRGEAGALPDLRDRLEGSPDLYAPARREPWASVNFATAHDGFTLRDLVSYDHKHNLANGEGNRDGNPDNRSWNCGLEGDGQGAGERDAEAMEAVEELRARQARNLLLLTLLARGTPMVLAGDEFLRTQGGNNNAYCQDGPVSWLDWTRAEKGARDGGGAEFLRFFRAATRWRSAMALPGSWGTPAARGWGRCWRGYTPAGKPWHHDHAPHSRQAAFLVQSHPAPGVWPTEPHPESNPLWYAMLNTEDAAATFRLPPLPAGWRWCRVADTALPSPDDIAEPGEDPPLPRPDAYEVQPRATVLLRARETD